MPIFDALDVGRATLTVGPDSGQSGGSLLVTGASTSEWALGGKSVTRSVTVNVQAPFAIGGSAAGSKAAVQLAVQQLMELAGNPDRNPVYTQWSSGDGTIAANPWDGYYRLDDIAPLEWIWSNHCPVQVTATRVALGALRQLGMATQGGALSSTYSGAATNWAALPYNATTMIPASTRVGAEGGIAVTTSPGLNPVPFAPSPTIADWFKGGVHVYDVMTGIGTNGVPSPPTVLHTNWVEVFGADHRFVGDIVIHNGLHLITLSPGATSGIVLYLWNTALGTAGWQQVDAINYVDNASLTGTLRQVSLQRVGAEETAVQLMSNTSGAKVAKHTLRLQRGSYTTRVDFDPLSEANTSVFSLQITLPSAPKILYNSGVGASVAVNDNALASQAQDLPATDYGYGAAFVASGTYPFLTGFLYQNPAVNQPYADGGASISLGDTSGPAQNATRSYGIFAIPLLTPQNLQGEAESGSFTGSAGWSSQAGAGGNSNNLEAKLASGSSSGAIDTFGTSWVPTAGSYRVAFRIKVTSAASSTSQFKYGLYNVTDSVYMQSATIAPNAVTTGWLWYSPGAAITPTAAKNMRFRCESTATTDTDWFCDEAVLLPITNGPQEIWQQFLYDRSQRLTVG